MDYEKAYKEALERAKSIYNEHHAQCADIMVKVFPELCESEDERIKNFLIDFIKICTWTEKKDQGWPSREDCLAWLEKQGDNNKWKPSKDEMDALYGLAYITNKMDDKKDKAITKLYQDLKREFFNGVSYENMFPLSSIDSSINIEKQGENTYNKELSELLHKVVCKFINSPDIPYSEREEVSKKIIPYIEQLEKTR